MRAYKSRPLIALVMLGLLMAGTPFIYIPPAQAYTGTINFTDVGKVNGNGPGIYFVADNGWVGGYSGSQCSNAGVGSPCFLPGVSATRGQISKFLANAKRDEGAQPQNPSNNTFADVPVGSTFFTYVETVNYMDGPVAIPVVVQESRVMDRTDPTSGQVLPRLGASSPRWSLEL